MGVSLTYETTHPVLDAVRRAVEAEAESINAERQWWCEGLIFFHSPENPLGLVGDTKLFRSDYETSTGEIVELDEEDDSFMAWRDAVYITSALARWSTAHGLTWTLRVLGNTSNTNGLTSYNNINGAITLDLRPWMTPAYTSNAGLQGLLDQLNTLLCAGQLSANARTTIVNYASTLPYTTPTPTQMRDRVRAVVHLIISSPEFTIQR